MNTDAEPVTPCAACEVGVAAFLLPSGAPVCPDCYLALASPETMRLMTTKELLDGQ
jgi:hypothetical protein